MRDRRVRSRAAQSARSIARFVGGDYLGSIFALAAVDLLPLLVVARLGAVDTGFFSVPFLIIYSLELVTVNLGVALTVEGAMDRSRAATTCVMVVRRIGAARSARRRACCSPFRAWCCRSSAAATPRTAPRCFACSPLGVVAKAVTTLYFSLARVERKVGRIAAIEASRLVLLLGSAWWLMGEFGLAGIGIAYLATQSVVAVVLVPGIVRVTRAPVRSSQPAA